MASEPELPRMTLPGPRFQRWKVSWLRRWQSWAFCAVGWTSPMAWMRRAACDWRAPRTAGLVWPRPVTPKAEVKSRKRLPSTSQTLVPSARSQKMGQWEAR